MDARAAIEAGLAGAVFSGIPSTAHALATGADPLEGGRAAGSMLLPREQRTPVLMMAAIAVHLSMSTGWAFVLARTLPSGRARRWAPAAGLGIAALDLGVIGRRFPRIDALPVAPQVADHLAYAWTVGAMLDRRRAE